MGRWGGRTPGPTGWSGPAGQKEGGGVVNKRLLEWTRVGSEPEYPGYRIRERSGEGKGEGSRGGGEAGMREGQQ